MKQNVNVKLFIALSYSEDYSQLKPITLPLEF